MLESRQRRLGACRPTPDGTEAIEEIMADIRPYQTRVATAGTRTDASIDEGLRAYMLKVYNLMGLGLVITGLAAFGTIMLATTGDPASAVATLPNGKMLTSFGLCHLRLAAEVGRHAGAARCRVLPVVQGQQAQRIGRADGLLGLRRPGRPLAVVDLPGLHQRQHRADLLRDGRRPSARCRSTAIRPSATSPRWARS